MALKESNKNRKKITNQNTPITIADIEAIRKMDHEQLYDQLEKTLGSTKKEKVLDQQDEVRYNEPESKFPTLQLVCVLSVAFLLILI